MANNCRETFNQSKTTSKAAGNRAFGNQRNETRTSLGLHAIEDHYDGLHQEFKIEGKVISGKFSIGNLTANVLFDYGADRSFISIAFLHISSISLKPQKSQLCIHLLDGTHFLCDRIFYDFLLEICENLLPVDLINSELNI